MRMHFNDLFTVSGGMIQPKVTVSIGGATFGPGVSFSASGGVSMGGVDVSQLVGKNLDVQINNGVHSIVGVFPY